MLWQAPLCGLCVLLLLTLGAAGCNTSDTNGEESPNGENGTKAELPPDAERIRELVGDYDDRDVWQDSREELVTLGTDAEEALFNLLTYKATHVERDIELRRLEGEFTWAVIATKSPFGLHKVVTLLMATSTTRSLAVRILERVQKGSVIVNPETGKEKSIPEAVKYSYLNRMPEVTDGPSIMAHCHVLQGVGAVGADEDGLGLMPLYQKLVRMRAGEDDWRYTARLMESLGYFAGKQSEQVLAAGTQDTDQSVRSIAEDALKRRKRRARKSKRFGMPKR